MRDPFTLMFEYTFDYYIYLWLYLYFHRNETLNYTDGFTFETWMKGTDFSDVVTILGISFYPFA